LDIQHPRLETRRADVFDQSSLETAFSGDVDAVVSAIGESRISKPTTLYSEAAKNTIAAMRAMQIQRLICIAASGYVDDLQQPFMFAFCKKIFCRKFFDMFTKI